MSTDPSPLIRVRGAQKEFSTLDAVITAVAGVDLDIEAGTVTALTGPSGSGKSTLLHLIGALDTLDAGTIHVADIELGSMTRRQSADYRRSVGFVFQRFNLIPTLTVLDNVLAPTLPFKTAFDARERARELLARVGVADRERTMATRLSGGQQQRVAIARALMFTPSIVLADEPTGNLDSATGADIIDLLFQLRAEANTTLIIATHDPALANLCDRVIRLRDGKLSGLAEET